MTALRLVDETDPQRALVVCTAKELAEALYRATGGAISYLQVIEQLAAIHDENQGARTWGL